MTVGYRVVERHESPDGVLTFAVIENEDGDVALGFLAEGAEPRLFGHTHPEIEADRWHVPAAEGVRIYVEDVTHGRRLIAISRVNGEVTDIWLPDRPDDACRNQPPEETIELRYWDGTLWKPT